MIVIGCGLIFSGYGGWLAKKRKGKPADIAQYAASFGLFGAIIGMVLTIVVDRSI